MAEDNTNRGNRGNRDNRDDNRGNRRPREDRPLTPDESRLVENSNFGGLINETIETLGTDLSGSASGRFMDVLAVKLWDEIGLRSTATLSGVVIGLKTAIRALRWAPNVQSFLEGVVEGLSRELWVRYRDLTRAQEEGRIEAELARLRGAPKAPHGATVPGSTPAGTPVVVVTAPKATYTTFHQMLTRHPRRADLMKVMAKLREAQPRVYEVVLAIEARPGFLEQFAEYALELNEDFREEALDRFMEHTIELAEKEHEEKVKASFDGIMESFQKGFKATLKKLDEVADALGLPKAPPPGRPTMPAAPPPAGDTAPPPASDTARAASNGEPKETDWARLKQLLRDKKR